MGLRRAAWAAVAAGLLAALAASGGRAAELAIPLGAQATMAVRILEYDRGLRGWSGGQLVVGVVARRASGAAELARALAGREAQGVPIRTVEHAWRDGEGLRLFVQRNGVRMLYLAEDLGADAAAALAAAGRMPSLVPSRRQFDAGATVGLVVRDGKPHILVNLAAARAAGMDLDPKLLQLSEVVR